MMNFAFPRDHARVVMAIAPGSKFEADSKACGESHSKITMEGIAGDTITIRSAYDWAKPCLTVASKAAGATPGKCRTEQLTHFKLVKTLCQEPCTYTVTMVQDAGSSGPVEDGKCTCPAGVSPPRPE